MSQHIPQSSSDYGTATSPRAHAVWHMSHRIRPRSGPPPNFFAIPLGLAGLGEVWTAAARILGTPEVVADVVNLLAAVVWTTLLLLYASGGLRRLCSDLRDPVRAPFVSLVPICAMLLGAALARDELAAGRAVVLVFLALTVLLGGWITGRWLAEDVPEESAHGGYFLPTVAGGFVGAAAAEQVGMHSIALGMFGIGVICWVMVGSVILNRIMFRASLPAALLPTLAIEVAPPAVGGIAYFAVSHGRTDDAACALAGYAVLMLVVQVRLVPVYAKLSFAPSFWSFTFPFAAVATDALQWLELRRPADSNAWAVVVVTLVSLLIGAVGMRTLAELMRGRLMRQVAAQAVK